MNVCIGCDMHSTELPHLFTFFLWQSDPDKQAVDAFGPIDVRYSTSVPLCGCD